MEEKKKRHVQYKPKTFIRSRHKISVNCYKNMYSINSYFQFLQMPCLGQVPEFAVRHWPMDYTFGGTVLEHR